jgi:hypothetical protein
LVIIKEAFCQPIKVGLNEVWVFGLFSAIALDLQRSLFVLNMTNNVKLAMQKPFDVHLVIKLCKTLTSFQFFENKIP